jgi:hypothetical protein
MVKCGGKRAIIGAEKGRVRVWVIKRRRLGNSLLRAKKIVLNYIFTALFPCLWFATKR